MGYRPPFQIDPTWSFPTFLEHLYAYYRGGGIESTGYRLNTIRNWLAMVGRKRAQQAMRDLEAAAKTSDDQQLAKSLWMATTTFKSLKRYVRDLPSIDDPVSMARPLKAFVSYKWESGEHVAWVRKIAADLRAAGIDAVLDQWEVRLGDSFTDYMQRHISDADVLLFVITPGSVAAAEAPTGQGGAIKFEVQMMNARRIADGTRIIGIYRSGDRPPHYLRDHRYIDFRDDKEYENALGSLIADLLGHTKAPPLGPPGTKRHER